MSKKLKTLGGILVVLLVLTTTVSAAMNSVSRADVTHNNQLYGEVYINAKSNNVYAETNADSQGDVNLDDTGNPDFVQVSAAGQTLRNSGHAYTSAYVNVPGTYSGNVTAAGTIKRGSVVATGATTAGVS